MEHKHEILIKRKDVKICSECGEILGEEESTFPDDETGLRNWFAVAAMEGFASHYGVGCEDLIAASAWRLADIMIAERGKHEKR
mgnify:CR=1 FL=1